MIFDLLTYWGPLTAIIVGLLAGGVILIRADEVGPVGLVLTGGAIAVNLLALIVFLLGWM